ncbi:MAG: peptide-binding protein, partial [Pseudomonadota bacterium]
RVYTDPRTPTAYASSFLRIRELRVLDECTVEAVYDKPYAPALESWADEGVLPKHLLEGMDITRSRLTRNPVGSGPYMVEEWITGDRIVLMANNAYLGPKPCIGRMMWRMVPDSATMFLLVKSGGIDWMDLAPLQYFRQTNDDWFRDNFKKYRFLDFSYNYLGYNLKNLKFKDKQVRQAITMAIDRERIISAVLLGLGRVAHSPYKPDTYWYNQSVPKIAYDPEKAGTLLMQAGWKDSDGDGILDKDGSPFEFTIVTNQGNLLRKLAAILIQDDLKKIGIKVNIRVIEWAALLKYFVHRGNYDACLLGWRLGMDPDQTDIWNSSKVGEHELNFVSYKNQEVDGLLDQGASTFNPQERKRYYDRFQEILADEVPYTFLWVPETLPLVHSRVQGIKASTLGIDYNLPEWYTPETGRKYEIQN